MKKLLLFCLAVTMMSVTAVAQTTWSVKAGAGISSYRISAKDLSASLNFGNRTGFYIGAANNFSISDSFDLQTELMYSNEGARLSVDNAIGNALFSRIYYANDDDYGFASDPSVTIRMNIMRLPVLLKFKTTEGLSILAGPYITYRMGLDLSIKNIDELASTRIRERIEAVGHTILCDNLREFDFGATLGLEYQLCNNIFVDVRYNTSFLNAIKKEVDLSIGGYDDKIFLKETLNGIEPTVRYHSLQIGLGYRF